MIVYSIRAARIAHHIIFISEANLYYWPEKSVDDDERIYIWLLDVG